MTVTTRDGVDTLVITHTTDARSLVGRTVTFSPRPGEPHTYTVTSVIDTPLGPEAVLERSGEFGFYRIRVDFGQNPR